MILITGGAGYIGSHVNKLLNNSGYETIVLDNLSKGHKSAVKWGEFVNADLSDSEKVREIFQDNDIEAVMHFAAFSSVAESVEEPEKYFKNKIFIFHFITSHIFILKALIIYTDQRCKKFILVYKKFPKPNNDLGKIF